MKQQVMLRGFPPLTRVEEETSDYYVVLAMIVPMNPQSTRMESEDWNCPLPKGTVEYVESQLSSFGKLCAIDHFQGEITWRLDLFADSKLLKSDVRMSIHMPVLEQLADQVLAEMQKPVQFIVSSVYEESMDFDQAQDELAMLLDHVLFLGVTDRVCGQNAAFHNESEPMLPNSKKINMEKQFFNAVISLNFQLACAVFLEIVQLETSVPETAISVKPRVINRLAWIIYVLGAPNRPPNKPLEHNTMASIAALNTSDSIENLRHEIEEIFDQFEQDYHMQEPASKFSQIKDYIDAHYRDCNLDAAQICDQFDISPSYLSQLFRRETGNTMLDYIHSLRISLVKDLMLQTSLPLQEIAQRSGYFSTWTLIRTFKKYEGITPGEYRKVAI